MKALAIAGWGAFAALLVAVVAYISGWDDAENYAKGRVR